MKYVLLKVQSESPAPEPIETYDDWDDVLDTYGSDMLFPLGGVPPHWANANELIQPATLAVRINKSHGFEQVGIIVPQSGLESAQRSYDEDEVIGLEGDD